MPLPNEKKEALIDRVAADVKKVAQDHYRSLVSHEVGASDAGAIVETGTARGLERVMKEPK